MEINQKNQIKLEIAIYKRDIERVKYLLQFITPSHETLNQATFKTLKDRRYIKIFDLLLEKTIPTKRMIEQACDFSNYDMLKKFAQKDNCIENKIRLFFYLNKKKELLLLFQNYTLPQKVFNEFERHTQFNPCLQDLFNEINQFQYSN